MKINREPLWMTKANRVLAIAAVAGGVAIGLHLFKYKYRGITGGNQPFGYPSNRRKMRWGWNFKAIE